MNKFKGKSTKSIAKIIRSYTFKRLYNKNAYNMKTRSNIQSKKLSKWNQIILKNSINCNNIDSQLREN